MCMILETRCMILRGDILFNCAAVLKEKIVSMHQHIQSSCQSVPGIADFNQNYLDHYGIS